MSSNHASKKNRKKVTAEKTVFTFAYLRATSWLCQKQVTARTDGPNPFLAASMIFSAFSVEAYLNHLGSIVTSFWPSVERRLSPSEKLDVLLKVLKVNVDFGKRPFQTFIQMFKFRNALAHGKTEKLTKESVQVYADSDFPELPMTDWEAEISSDSADIYLLDSKQIITFLQKQAGLDTDQLFSLNESTWSAQDINN